MIMIQPLKKSSVEGISSKELQDWVDELNETFNIVPITKIVLTEEDCYDVQLNHYKLADIRYHKGNKNIIR